MKNKFEALKAFMDWPKEWQQLCAEFWAESDINQDVRTWSTSGKLATVGQLMRPQPQRAAKVMPARPWSIADDEALVKLHDGRFSRSKIIRQFMSSHPYRTFNAVASRHDHLRRLDWKVQ